MQQFSLLFLINDTQILLAMKKRGYGVDRWNGVGGKQNRDEDIRQTAIRECQEEIKVKPLEFKEMASLIFTSAESKEDYGQRVIVFTCKVWQGNPTETEEMAPKWFNLDNIPYTKMWPDDKYWLPQVIQGKYVNIDFRTFDRTKLK